MRGGITYGQIERMEHYESSQEPRDRVPASKFPPRKLSDSLPSPEVEAQLAKDFSTVMAYAAFRICIG